MFQGPSITWKHLPHDTYVSHSYTSAPEREELRSCVPLMDSYTISHWLFDCAQFSMFVYTGRISALSTTLDEKKCAELLC